ncbi:hypothetical protein [Mucilaginibacter myungsuensis]|uniref:Dolichyl-phosphate-mannose-protein mannosyltransferase n=1 Tax=Mucilaginibacter myungsuensis TaxID=649104 RepID=A0A929KV16_9SPHI|nr:hypothetical protein [Mucilaginibacter myungsuensis]MBE9660970.1 hypothetical protein [Mucilaginibacter myungsuensis]MDN3601016.1 hypothetical protein [Mucilaginibacter myungsuensis]
MSMSKNFMVLVLTLVLAGYYVFVAVYLNNMGYYNQESLFYIEKGKIVFDGIGQRLKVIGLTAPLFPFYATFVFSIVSEQLSAVLASAVGTAVLFNIMANAIIKRLDDEFYVFFLLGIFLIHPGILYAACSGKSVYLILIFFFLFYLNFFKFYLSNTTFHVSIASICLVVLVFCDYKFIWLTLFFLPLVLSISIDSLNLSEKESVFRLFISFNNPSLRRKLINKTFAMYIIIFILPLVSVLIYKMLNLTHAADLNYFIDSPYATWSVMAEKIDYNVLLDTTMHHKLPEAPIVISTRMILYCPMILVAIYLYRQRTYQILTLLTPFAFVEFLRIKYDKVYLAQQYYLIFLILALLCVVIRAVTIKEQKAFKIMLVILGVVQIYSGYMFLDRSYVKEEQTFIRVLMKKEAPDSQNENIDMANYINALPGNPRLLIDDGVAYPVAAFIKNVQGLIMPYEERFLSAVESPGRYASYILVASTKNPANGYTQLTPKYLQILRTGNNKIYLEKRFETNDWILYKIDQH